MTFRLPPYLKWRDGRPRWEPGPRLRHAFRARDLKDDAGAFLGLEAAIAAAKKLNDDVATWRKGGNAPSALPRVNRAPPNTVKHLYEIYASPKDVTKASPKFRKLAKSSQRDYIDKLAVFVDEFGTFQVRALRQSDIYSWWEEIYSERGHSMANGVIACARAMLSYGVMKGWITVNPAKSLGLEKTAPRVVVWTPSELEAFVNKADELGHHGVADAVVIGLHTGQRQADVLNFEWVSADNGRARFRQRKTGAFVSVPHTHQLAERIEKIKARRREGKVAELTLTGELVRTQHGRKYEKSNFGWDFREVRAKVADDQVKAGGEATILGKKYLDLRDTSVTRLALAGATVPEIRAITGHTLETIHKVLAHYLALDDRMADAAIAKLKIWIEQEGIAI